MCIDQYSKTVTANTSRSLPLGTLVQVRPNDNIRFKDITLEQAFAAIHKTDALIAAVTALAQGKTTVKAAEAELSAPPATVAEMPATQAVLVKQEASEENPGLLIRLAGDRWEGGQSHTDP